MLLAVLAVGACRKSGERAEPPATMDVPARAVRSAIDSDETRDGATGDHAPPADGRATVCEAEIGWSPDKLDAQHAACRSLCERGSARHCERLAAVCGTGIPGGTLCPAEIVWAQEQACELGSGDACMAAARAYRQGAPGATADAAKAAALETKACTIRPALCPTVAPADAAAALDELTSVPVAGGTFRPGFRPYDTPDQPQDFRLPPITLGPFDIDRTEATVGAYAACVHAGKCPAPQVQPGCNWGVPDRLRHPMNCVTDGEAAAFCAWRGRRLPTQDEWELAARGTDDRPYPWGNDAPADQLCWKQPATCVVGSHPSGASPSGALDMEGNVQEWTADTAQVTNAAVPFIAVVSRGSSYDDSTTSRMGLNNQHYNRSGESGFTLGFRCVSAAPTAVATTEAP